jgi:hypothetical protein
MQLEATGHTYVWGAHDVKGVLNDRSGFGTLEKWKDEKESGKKIADTTSIGEEWRTFKAQGQSDGFMWVSCNQIATAVQISRKACLVMSVFGILDR